MYELLIVACLVGQPTQCETFHIPFDTPSGIRQCMHDAQFRLAEWKVTMPEWKVKKWTCGLPKT